MPEASSSAPPYAPQRWNSSVTPAQTEFFFDKYRTEILNIAIRESSEASPLDELSRGMRGGLGNEKKGWAIEKAGEDFFANDRRLGSDDKLAARYAIDPAKLDDFRRDLGQMRMAYAFQNYSNCYTYATNRLQDLNSPDLAGGGEIPGTLSERPGYGYNAAMANAQRTQDYEGYKRSIIEGMLQDGAQAGGPDAPARAGFYRVAVFARDLGDEPHRDAARLDMHFVRENQDGTWSHKLGTKPVSDRDLDRQVINDPKRMKLGYDFMQYMYVPEGGLTQGLNYPPRSETSAQAKDIERAGAWFDNMRAGSMSLKAADAALQKDKILPATVPPTATDLKH